MNVLVVLIPASLLLGGIGLAAFLWTAWSDQYDDPLGNASRILTDDEADDGGEEQADAGDFAGEPPPEAAENRGAGEPASQVSAAQPDARE